MKLGASSHAAGSAAGAAGGLWAAQRGRLQGMDGWEVRAAGSGPKGLDWFKGKSAGNPSLFRGFL